MIDVGNVCVRMPRMTTSVLVARLSQTGQRSSPLITISQLADRATSLEPLPCICSDVNASLFGLNVASVGFTPQCGLHVSECCRESRSNDHLISSVIDF